MALLTPNRVQLWLTAQHHAARERFVRGPFSRAAFELVLFGIKQGWACLFGGLLLAVLVLTLWLYPADARLARYDFLFLACLLIQAAMLLTGLETASEARVILVFHVVGTAMEVFKTHVGSWTYPEPSLIRIGDVPLFSGFMYAAVGSYMARVWRLFDFRFERFPPLWVQGLLALAAYANFFSHHFGPDIRGLLFAVSAVLYLPCRIYFRVDQVHRWMPLGIGLVLVALFIWLAENLATYARAWVYPDQADGWRMVSVSKLGAWYLLMLISFVLVASLHPRARSEPARAAS